MLPMPTLGWWRPVRSAARLGGQGAVVWNALERSAVLATQARVGVGLGAPTVLDAPKPVSSVVISRMFGAPFGAVAALGKTGLESLVVRPMTPRNGGSGTGRTGAPPIAGFPAGLSCP